MEQEDNPCPRHQMLCLAQKDAADASHAWSPSSSYAGCQKFESSPTSGCSAGLDHPTPRHVVQPHCFAFFARLLSAQASLHIATLLRSVVLCFLSECPASAFSARSLPRPNGLRPRRYLRLLGCTSHRKQIWGFPNIRCCRLLKCFQPAKAAPHGKLPG